VTAVPAPGAGPAGCIVPLAEDDQISERMRSVLARDRRLTGDVRSLTRALASSEATWQAVTRAEHFYAMTRVLDVRTQTLACLYTSLLNGCLYCIDDAAGAAIEAGMPAAELLALRNLSVPELGEGTVARLLFTRWAVREPGRIPVHVVVELRRHAGNEEILELTAAVAMKCFWNHFVSALGIPPEGRCPQKILLGQLSDISRELRAGA
jgi:AhpD family alkylhydroperoxidase